MLIDCEDGDDTATVAPDTTTNSAATATYENKRKMLFESLNAAEQCIKGTTLEQKNERPPNKYSVIGAELALAGKRFQGKESIFKKPELSITKCLKPRRTPDYQVNPHKWKKYTLDDTDTSDRTNTAAAFDFLREIENRKRARCDDGRRDEDDDMDDQLGGKIIFKTRTKRAPNAVDTPFNKSVVQLEAEQRPVLRGSKVLMPEYVVGQRVARGEKKVPTGAKVEKAATASKVLKLGHLFEDEDEDSD